MTVAAETLAARFANLPPASGTAQPGVQAYTASKDDAWDWWIARNDTGEPSVLIPGTAGYRPALELEYLTFRPYVHCIVDNAGRLRRGAFAVITLRRSTAELQAAFWRIVARMLASRLAGGAEWAQLVDDLATLFQSLATPSHRDARGLWAELFVIVNSRKPSGLATAWHAFPGDVFDFNSGSQRLEVKASGTGQRDHHFTLQQLNPPKGTELFVVSILADSAGNGVSLSEVLDRANHRLSGHPSLQWRVESTVARLLGPGYLTMDEFRFDEQQARQSLAVFDGPSVPHISLAAVPSDVYDVRFQVHLRGEGTAPQGLRSRGGLVACL